MEEILTKEGPAREAFRIGAMLMYRIQCNSDQIFFFAT